MSKPIAIRYASSTDDGRLLTILNTSLRKLAAEDYDPLVIDAIIINSSWMIDGMIARERCFVAECGGMVVGWGGWAPRASARAWLDRNRRCSPPHAELRALYVDPEWIRLGFARRLLTQIESDMASNGHRQVDLIATMHSIAFFRRLGYGGDKVRETKLPRDVPFCWLDMSKALEPSPSPVLGTG